MTGAAEGLGAALPWIAGGLGAVFLLAALQRPLRWLCGLVARTGVGLAVLWLLRGVGGFLGIGLGVNLTNALVLGLLGAPGFGLLLLMEWVLAG